MQPNVNTSNPRCLRLAKTANWDSLADSMPNVPFERDSPVVLCQLGGVHWRLDQKLQEALQVSVEVHHTVPFLVLRYQWGSAQVALVSDGADAGVWACLDTWQKRRKAQLLLVERDGMSQQTPVMPTLSESVRSCALAAAEFSPQLLSAAMGVAANDGEFTSDSGSLIADVPLSGSEVFAVKSSRLIAGLTPNSNLVREVDWLRQLARH